MVVEKFIFYAANAKIASEPDSVDLEEMEIVLLHESEIINAIKNKNIISIGTITALSLAKIYLQGRITMQNKPKVLLIYPEINHQQAHILRGCYMWQNHYKK